MTSSFLRLYLIRAFLVAACSAAAFAQAAASNAVAPVPNPVSIDKHVDPCADFYQYACGGWLATNSIPADRASWGTGEMLVERDRLVLRDILDHAADSTKQRSNSEQQIGDYYSACMDERTDSSHGDAPIKPDLDRIDAIADKAALRNEVPRLYREGIDIFFDFGSATDLKDSVHVIGEVAEAGLGLPNRDLYLNSDPHSASIRDSYIEHISRMLQLTGEPATAANSDAKAVLAFETSLAQHTLDPVSRRNPDSIYHKLSINDLAKLCPFFSWRGFFEAAGAPAMEFLDVDHPEFFSALNSAINAANLNDLKAYLRWHLVHSEADVLSDPFVQENFAFYGHVLTGLKELRLRWKRCVDSTDVSLPDAVDKVYVDKTFGTQGKQRTLAMVKQIEKEMKGNLGSLDWMTPATKKEALGKLDAVTNRIGYPDKWKDYSGVKIVRDDFEGDWRRAKEFRIQYDLGKIGKPVDRSEWPFPASTVNAGYEPDENSINFPAGILQPPLYSNESDDAANYGAGGAIIGHELTHGFDDEGRRFDAQGNLRDWWTKADAEEFERRAKCLVDEYSKFEALPGLHVNGQLTLGENTADVGGLRLAFMALMDSLKDKPLGVVDGYTPQQRFFLSYAQAWCQLEHPERTRILIQRDPHASPRFRVDGVVQNMPEFQKAFSCAEGSPMAPAAACRIW